MGQATAAPGRSLGAPGPQKSVHTTHPEIQGRFFADPPSTALEMQLVYLRFCKLQTRDYSRGPLKNDPEFRGRSTGTLPETPPCGKVQKCMHF